MQIWSSVNCRSIASIHGSVIQVVLGLSLRAAVAAELLAFVWPFDVSGKDELKCMSLV